MRHGRKSHDCGPHKHSDIKPCKSAYARKRKRVGKSNRQRVTAALRSPQNGSKKQTDTASGAAYRQMNKRLERAPAHTRITNRSGQTLRRRHLDRHNGQDNRKELLHLTEGIIIFGSGRMTSSNDAARTPTQSILHADGHQWKVAHNPGMSGEKPRSQASPYQNSASDSKTISD